MSIIEIRRTHVGGLYQEEPEAHRCTEGARLETRFIDLRTWWIQLRTRLGADALPEERRETAQRASAVGKLVLVRWAHLGERPPASALRHEHRVVTETPQASRDQRDLPFYYALAHDLGAIGKATEHDSTKPRLPVELALEHSKQLGDVVGVGSVLPGKAGRPCAGRSTEYRHLETGVIGDCGFTGRRYECDGLETGILLEALPGLLHRTDALWTGNEIDQIIELLFQNGL